MLDIYYLTASDWLAIDNGTLDCLVVFTTIWTFNSIIQIPKAVSGYW